MAKRENDDFARREDCSLRHPSLVKKVASSHFFSSPSPTATRIGSNCKVTMAFKEPRDYQVASGVNK
ncbi:unnamed protein product [Anisakis simplex]|uniref:Kinesin motor domain-containing protein n=1 Tax=Anisakis simplex TaxID=6269 RepID=A0A0M3JP05_ANISI|nr:unnamed protein product [Anisakis simplex]